MQLPFADGSFDVTYSSNVLEHVSEPWTMADEMVRVTRPGGLVFLSYTLWYGPWGGHETVAVALPRRPPCAPGATSASTGTRPRTSSATSLFPVTAAAGLRWARRQSARRRRRGDPALPPALVVVGRCASPGCASW